MLFNAEGAIQKYASPEDILRDFYDLRLAYYVKRRAALLRVRHAVLCCWSPAGPGTMPARRGNALSSVWLF